MGAMVALARLAPFLAGRDAARHAAAVAIIARSPSVAPGIFGVRVDGSLLDNEDEEVA